MPVGLTRHRDGLYPLRSITPAEASATLDAIHAWQAGFLARLGTRLVFAADELYLQARAADPARRGVRGLLRGRGRSRPRPAVRGRSPAPGQPARAPSLARAARGDGGDRRAVRADPRPAAGAGPRTGAPGRGGRRAERVLRPRDHRGRAPHGPGRGAGPLRAVAGGRGPDPARGPDGDEGRVPRRRGARRTSRGTWACRSSPWTRARAGSSTACSTGRPRRREGATSVRLPVVAIVGRPNVGKSTLFNRLTGSRKAIVRDTPGVTRDRIHGTCEFGGWRATVIDTGGLDPTSDEPLTAQVRKQVLAAIAEADALVFVVDGREGLTPLRPGGGAAAPPGGQAGRGGREQGRREGARGGGRRGLRPGDGARCCSSRPSMGGAWPS